MDRGDEVAGVASTSPLVALADELYGLEAELLEAQARLRSRIIRCDSDWRESATNLIHYAALRSRELRGLQDALARQGLSSLGRSEPHVLATLRAVRGMLPSPGRRGSALVDAPAGGFAKAPPFGNEALTRHTEALFGPGREDRQVRIMVTMPSQAATHPGLARELVRAGMDVMRINCAHDGPEAWEAMCAHLRLANMELGARCRVQFDLEGPKLRTGPFEDGPRVFHWKPERDELGNVRRPARVRLVPERPSLPRGSGLPLSRDFLGHLAVGRVVELVDLRGRRRSLEVVSRGADEVEAIGAQSAWVGPDTEFEVRIPGAGRIRARPETLTPRAGRCELSVGEVIRLVGPALRGHAGSDLDVPQVSCTLPEALRALRRGHRVWFDDGRIGGVVTEAHPEWSLVRLTDGPPAPVRLVADKGINLPDTALETPALAPDDLGALDIAARLGDLVALSFVRTPSDVEALHAELDRRFAGLGVILKIETRTGFENLAGILLTAMQRPPFGIMIARGDLAVECGFARLAEVQEEMLCLCEAAHAPIVWATQVLESAARKGFPSRAEVTDAAVGGRAECVMLNKGPFIPQAVRTLSDILARMESHQRKKTPLFRRLQSVLLEEMGP